MDEIKIVSEFLRGHISDLLENILRKKLGYDFDIRLNEFTLTCDDGKTRVHLDLDCEAPEDDIDNIFKLLQKTDEVTE